MNSKDELYKKITEMDVDELSRYHTVAKSTTRIVDVVGVGLVLVMMFHTSLITIIPGTFLLFILANVSAGMGDTIDFLEERMAEIIDK